MGATGKVCVLLLNLMCHICTKGALEKQVGHGFKCSFALVHLFSFTSNLYFGILHKIFTLKNGGREE